MSERYLRLFFGDTSTTNESSTSSLPIQRQINAEEILLEAERLVESEEYVKARGEFTKAMIAITPVALLQQLQIMEDAMILTYLDEWCDRDMPLPGSETDNISNNAKLDRESILLIVNVLVAAMCRRADVDTILANYNQAENFYCKARDIFERFDICHPGERRDMTSNAILAILNFRLANLYVEVGVAWEGKRLYDLGVDIVTNMCWNASSTNPIELLTYADSLSSAATMSIQLGNFEHVISDLERAIDIYKQICDSSIASLSLRAQKSVATTSIQLSNAISLIKADNIRALELVDYSLAIRLKCYSQQHTLIADAKYHKARLLAAIAGQQNLKDALDLMYSSLDLFGGKLGRQHPYSLNSAHSVAEIKQLRGMPCGDVPQLLHNSLEQRTALYLAIYDSPWGKEGGNSVSRLECCGNLTKQHPCMSQSLFTLGFNAEIRGDLKEAQTHYEEALKINLAQQVAMHATSHVGVASCYLALGNVCRLMSNFSEANTLLDLASKALAAFFPPEHTRVIECGLVKAELMMDKGQYTAARECFSSLLKIMTTSYGSSHPITARILHSYAVNERLSGDHRQSFVLSEQALMQRLFLFGNEHYDTLIVSINKFKLMREYLGSIDEAVPELEKIRVILKNKFGGPHPILAHLLNEIAECLRLQKKLSVAEMVLREAIEMQRIVFHVEMTTSVSGSDSVCDFFPSFLQDNEMPISLFGLPNIGETILIHARLLVDKGNPRRAREIINYYAIPLFEAALGPAHPLSYFARGELALVDNLLQPGLGNELLQEVCTYFTRPPCSFAASHMWVSRFSKLTDASEHSSSTLTETSSSSSSSQELKQSSVDEPEQARKGRFPKPKISKDTLKAQLRGDGKGGNTTGNVSDDASTGSKSKSVGRNESPKKENANGSKKKSKSAAASSSDAIPEGAGEEGGDAGDDSSEVTDKQSISSKTSNTKTKNNKNKIKSSTKANAHAEVKNDNASEHDHASKDAGKKTVKKNVTIKDGKDWGKGSSKVKQTSPDARAAASLNVGVGGGGAGTPYSEEDKASLKQLLSEKKVRLQNAIAELQKEEEEFLKRESLKNIQELELGKENTGGTASRPLTSSQLLEISRSISIHPQQLQENDVARPSISQGGKKKGEFKDGDSHAMNDSNGGQSESGNQGSNEIEQAPESPTFGTLESFKYDGLRLNTPAASQFMGTDEMGSSRSSLSAMSLDSGILSASRVQVLRDLPFPFYEAPSIPDVNKYVANEKFYFHNIKKALDHQGEEDESVTSMRRWKRKLKMLEKKHLRYLQQLQHQQEGGGNLIPHTRYTEADVAKVMSYIHSCCKPDVSADGGGTGTGTGAWNEEVSLSDLEAAFRKHRQAKHSVEEEEIARDLMVSLEYLLHVSNLTPEEWFYFADVKGGIGGDGKVTLQEFSDSIHQMCKHANLPAWHNDVIHCLLRYMDPSGDGDLTEAEVRLAFTRFKMPNESQQILEAAGPIIAGLEECMKAKQMRIRDLFHSIDTDKSSTISFSELTNALRSLLFDANKRNYPSLQGSIANLDDSSNEGDDGSRSQMSQLDRSIASISSLGTTSTATGSLMSSMMGSVQQQSMMYPSIFSNSYFQSVSDMTNARAKSFLRRRTGDERRQKLASQTRSFLSSQNAAAAAAAGGGKRQKHPWGGGVSSSYPSSDSSTSSSSVRDGKMSASTSALPYDADQPHLKGFPPQNTTVLSNTQDAIMGSSDDSSVGMGSVGGGGGGSVVSKSSKKYMHRKKNRVTVLDPIEKTPEIPPASLREVADSLSKPSTLKILALSEKMRQDELTIKEKPRRARKTIDLRLDARSNLLASMSDPRELLQTPPRMKFRTGLEGMDIKEVMGIDAGEMDEIAGSKALAPILTRLEKKGTITSLLKMNPSIQSKYTAFLHGYHKKFSFYDQQEDLARQIMSKL